MRLFADTPFLATHHPPHLQPCFDVYDTQKHAWGDPKNCAKGDSCPNSHTLMEVCLGISET